MRKFIVQVVECIFVSICACILLSIVFDVGIDMWQYFAIGGGIVILVYVASGIRKVIDVDEVLHTYEWWYRYEEHTILVKAKKTLELYVDGKLTDEKTGACTKAELKGLSDTGEKITALITVETNKNQRVSDKIIKCKLLIDGKSF